jgi:hypothetical protein
MRQLRLPSSNQWTRSGWSVKINTWMTASWIKSFNNHNKTFVTNLLLCVRWLSDEQFSHIQRQPAYQHFFKQCRLRNRDHTQRSNSTSANTRQRMKTTRSNDHTRRTSFNSAGICSPVFLLATAPVTNSRFVASYRCWAEFRFRPHFNCIEPMSNRFKRLA